MQLLDVKYSCSVQIRVVIKGNDITKNKSNNSSDELRQLLNDDASTSNCESKSGEDMQKI